MTSYQPPKLDYVIRPVYWDVIEAYHAHTLVDRSAPVKEFTSLSYSALERIGNGLYVGKRKEIE